ncbi:MAG: hypothetical protein AAGK92_03325 [Pseudomonadota bacterium]
MKTQKTWITKTIQDAAKVTTKMPWERGTTRAAFIAKRKGAPTAKRVSA